MVIPQLVGRENLIDRQAEACRPPNFRAPTTRLDCWLAEIRRIFDLQAASIWNDLKLLLPRCEGTVLDVGCGAQPYRPLVPSTVRYTGIDTTDARDHFGYEVPDTIYFDGDKWPVTSESIDVVLATETLEHVVAPDRFLAEARRCLKPTGILILTVPFAARWHYIPHDYWRFTPSGLCLILTHAGFVDPLVYARGNEITVLCYKVMAPILTLLLGQSHNGVFHIIARVLGVLLFPILIPLAAIAQVSLRSRGGDECLGYTVVVSVTDLPSGVGV